MDTSFTKFLDEFQSLETQYYAIPRANLQFASLYRSLLHRADEYKSTYWPDSWPVFHLLRLALMCRVMNTKNDAKNLPGMELKSLLTSLEQRTKQYENTIVDVSVRDRQSSNESTITELIVEMMNLLLTCIPSLIDEKCRQIDDKIRTLSEDIIDRMKRGETNNTTELTDKRNELVAQLTTKAALGVMKTTSFSPVYSSLTEILLVLPKNHKNAIVKTIGTSKYLRSDYFKSERALLKIQLENPKVNSVRAEFARDVEHKNTFDKIASFREILDKNVPDEAYLEQKTSVKKQLDNYLILLYKAKFELEKQSDKGSATNKSGIEKILDWLTYIQAAIIAGELGIDSIQQNDNLVSALGNRITEVYDTITPIKEYEYWIRNSALRLIAENNENIYPKQYLNLENSKQKLVNITKEFEMKMKRMIERQPEFYLKTTLNYIIDKLSTALTTLIKVHDRIQDNKDHQTLHKYIEQISWTQATQDILTKAHKKVENDLKFIIKSNLVSLEYEKAVELFKLYIFPYAEKYGGHFDIFSYLASKNIKALTESAAKEIVNMREIFSASDALPSKGNITIDLKFAPGVEARNETAKLLRGEEILVDVDIRRDLHRANAIKFNDIRLRFVLANATLQKELDEKLVDLELNMLHLGDSHYRCDEQFYISYHDSIRWFHDWIKQNDSRNYMANVRPIFSPYATWSLQLRRRIGNDSLQLEKFANEKIDLVLDVRGSYIPSNSTVCKTYNLEKYYELDKPSEDTSEHAENHRRRRQATSNKSSESVQPASSSANLLKSPINAAINLLGGVVGYATDYGSIKLGIQSIFGRLTQFNAYGTPKDFDNSPMTGAKFGIYESLTLADFFIRWVTKVKPYCNSMEDAMNPDMARTCALNIIEEFEAILKELVEQFDLYTGSLEFDPVVLMTDLEKEITNHNFIKIENILLDTVMMNSRSNDSQFNDIARGKIRKIFGQ